MDVGGKLSQIIDIPRFILVLNIESSDVPVHPLDDVMLPWATMMYGI